jgi:hypothetical protein
LKQTLLGAARRRTVTLLPKNQNLGFKWFGLGFGAGALAEGTTTRE